MFMKHSIKLCAMLLIVSSMAPVLFAGHVFAYRYYHISRPKLGFELGYEFERDKRRGPFIESDNETTTSTERLDIETEGWLYHPALVEFDLTLSPEWEQVREEQSSGERIDSQNSFLQGYDAEFVFLQYKPYTITLFGNRSLSTVDSNLAQKSKIEADEYGVRLNLKYKTLPTRLEYTHYENEQSGFFNSTTEKDEVRLNMRYDEYLGNTIVDMIYFDVFDTSSQFSTSSTSKEASLQNIYRFPSRKNITLTSFVTYRDKESSFYLERGVYWNEDLLWRHKKNLSTNYNGRYESFDLLDGRRREYQSFDFTLNHLLYENLTTILRADASKNHNESGQEGIYGGGLEWIYTRQIPGGTMNAVAAHSYSIHDKQPDLSTLAIPVTNEVIILTDSAITFLSNKLVERSSIALYEKRPDGTRSSNPYIENIDYLIIVIGDFTGIIRRAGTTSIPSGAEVFADYRHVNEPPFDFSLFDRSYGISFNLWKSLKTYYRFFRSSQRFLRGIEPETLRTYLSETVGLEYRWKWSTTALEYVNISSTEIPTERWTASESLAFRPTSKMYTFFYAGFGETRFKELDKDNDTSEFQNYRATMQLLLSRRSNLLLEGFFNKSSGVTNKTQDAGVSSLLQLIYNIYTLDLKYEYDNEKDRTSRETCINHLFLVTIKRELF